jgi:hypothetical protein
LAAAKALLDHCVPLEEERCRHLPINRAIVEAVHRARNPHRSQMAILVVSVGDRVLVPPHIVLCRQTTIRKGCQSSSLQTLLSEAIRHKGNRGIDARSRGRCACDRPRGFMLAIPKCLGIRVLHTQDHRLGQRLRTVPRRIRGVDKVRQGRDSQRLRGTGIHQHHGPIKSFRIPLPSNVNVRPVDGRRPIWILHNLWL